MVQAILFVVFAVVVFLGVSVVVLASWVLRLLDHNARLKRLAADQNAALGGVADMLRSGLGDRK